MISPVGDPLWKSTVFAAAETLTVASGKFLIPFALLTATPVGEHQPARSRGDSNRSDRIALGELTSNGFRSLNVIHSNNAPAEGGRHCVGSAHSSF